MSKKYLVELSITELLLIGSVLSKYNVSSDIAEKQKAYVISKINNVVYDELNNKGNEE